MSAFLKALSDKDREAELGGQMSFLEHLDELRRRLVRSFVVVLLAMTGSWFVSVPIYNFLARPIERALAEAQRQEVPIAGLTGNETISTMQTLKENDTGRFVFAEETKLGTGLIPTGASVMARVIKVSQGKNLVAYALSKSLLFKLAEFLNESAKGKNVTATVVAPSTLDTPLNRKSMPDTNPADWVSPQKLAELLEYTVSDSSSILRETVLKAYNNS